MRRLKYILTALILGASVQLTACGTEDGSVSRGQSDEYRTELTKDEIKGGHVSFHMDENLVVDADVTAEEKYEKGLSSYYLKVFCETEKKSEKKFLEAPTLSLHSFEEWEKMLNKILPGKFKDKTFQLDKKDADIQQAYQGENGNSYSFHVNWSNYTRGVEEKTRFNTPVIKVGFDSGGASYEAKTVRSYVQDYHGSDEVSFLQDAEGYIERMKEFLKEITGRSVYEGYDFSVVSKETIGMLKEAHSWMTTIDEPEEEYAAFYFYFDIDGLPLKRLTLEYLMENDETADELCYWSSEPGNRLTGLSEHEQEMLIDKDGVIYLECSNMWDSGEVYKEGLSVVSPNEALKQVKEHYSRQLLKEECVVTDIGLVYSGYFSDGADGEIRPIISPFWAIKVYEGDNKSYVYFVYDAYTGECISEGV